MRLARLVTTDIRRQIEKGRGKRKEEEEEEEEEERERKEQCNRAISSRDLFFNCCSRPVLGGLSRVTQCFGSVGKGEKLCEEGGANHIFSTMLTSSANQYLRPEYLTPLPTTVSVVLLVHFVLLIFLLFLFHPLRV